MRLDPSFTPALFAQAADIASQPSITAGIIALLGTGTLGTLIGTYLKARADREKLAAEEESSRRRAKHDAELKQLDALTEMARSVPSQFKEMGDRFDKFAETMMHAVDKLAAAHAATDRKIDSTTAATDALSAELFSENRVLMRAIAKQLGVQPDEAPVSVSGLPTAPATHVSGMRTRHHSQPGR